MLKLDRLRHQYTKPLPALHLQQIGAGSLNEPVVGHGCLARVWAGGFASP
jgi:hypothetical protein